MIENLFADLPATPVAEERFDTLLQRQGLKIERIVSTGQCSPPGFWYDQPNAEWVAVLQGHAQLSIEGEPAPRPLRPGDFVEIPAHRRHRVDATRDDGPTVWLAIHY
jgi:cupin 2 domain-containing protein